MFSPNNLNLATCSGVCALFFWAFGVVFIVYLSDLPIFEVVYSIYTVSFAATCLKLTLCKEWSKVKQSWLSLLIGMCLVYGNQLSYISAFRLVPAVHADLINYTWPLVTFFLTSYFFPSEKVKMQHFAGAILGFLGVYTLLTWDSGLVNAGYWVGYFLAFSAAVCWSLYLIFMRSFKNASESIGLYQGLGLPLMFLLQYQKGSSLVPEASLFEFGCITAVGILCAFSATTLWSFAVIQGDFKILNLLSNFTPILSVCFLLLFGFGNLNGGVFLSFLFVLLGSFIGSKQDWEWSKWRVAFSGGSN